MTFAHLPDDLPMGENIDPEFLEQLKEQREAKQKKSEEIEHPNPGKSGDIKKFCGPKVIHVPVYKEPSRDFKETWLETNAASRDIVFHCIGVAGQKRPHLKRFRDNMEKSKSLKGLMGNTLSLCNRNPWTQMATLATQAYLKALSE